MIKYNIEIDGSTIKFQIEEMDERLRFNPLLSKNSGTVMKFVDEITGKDVYIGSNIFGPKIDVGNYKREVEVDSDLPDVEYNINYAIYLRGDNRELDNEISTFEFDTEEEAIEFKEVIERAIDKYIERHKILTTEPKSVEEILKEMENEKNSDNIDWKNIDIDENELDI